MYARKKQKIREWIRQGLTMEQIKDLFPRSKVLNHEIHEIRSKMRENLYWTQPDGTVYKTCPSCGSSKPHTPEFFHRSLWKYSILCTTCKECRNRLKRNMRIINGNRSNYIICKRYKIRKKIKFILRI